MSSEARINSMLNISSGMLRYQSQPPSFTADVAGSKGPVPGAISVPVLGVDVDFSELGTPGLCRIMNLDDTNYVEVGVHDPETDVYMPLLELLPGESYVVRLSRMLGWEYGAAGTGTTGGNNSLHIRSNAAPCNVLVEAFEV